MTFLFFDTQIVFKFSCYAYAFTLDIFVNKKKAREAIDSDGELILHKKSMYLINQTGYRGHFKYAWSVYCCSVGY